MKERTTTGKVDSKNWRHQATLRDLLNLLDDIEAMKDHPEHKAKLRQVVIDYGQHLSEEIYLGKRSVPESDDNETIKEFNNRFFGSYDTKGKSSYEEAKQEKGYYDRNDKFIKVLNSRPKDGNDGARNPRWHPIPVNEITPPPPPPPPIDPTNTGDNGIIIDNGGNGGGGTTNGGGGTTNGGGGTTNGGSTSNTSSEAASKVSETPAHNRERKRRSLWLLPLILGATLGVNRCEPTPEKIIPVDTNDNKDTTEVVTKTYTSAEKEHLRYTVEKGEGLLAHQLGIKDEKLVSELYEQCVENLRKGNIPETMKELSNKYQMSKMVNDELGINLDEPEIAVTGWLTMSTSYDNVRQVILDGLLKSKETSPKESMNLTKRLSQANEAAIANNADPRSSQVFTIDYGLYGATEQIGKRIIKNDYVKYGDVVNRVFKDKDGRGY